MINKITGNFLYYLSWPLIWFYAPLFIRVRVIISCGDEYLVVKNWFGSGKWSLPGGGKKFSELAIDAAIREINEELSLDIKNNTRQLSENVQIVKHNGLLFRYQYFRSEIKSKTDIVLSREISEFKWVKKHELSLPEVISSNL